ncbi:MAG: AAA family ATPase [Chloroflexi bacterium]|nr:AAA family ATPase [Chloroflexota bacterium]OJV91746.1 MAG: hypothetical protein BGO39_17785 [Chloroflexi bacterium 54-19]
MSSSPNASQVGFVKTGLEGLDTILGGGIPSGSLIMLVGEPGTGKTTLLQQLCFTWTGSPATSTASNDYLTKAEEAEGQTLPSEASITPAAADAVNIIPLPKATRTSTGRSKSSATTAAPTSSSATPPSPKAIYFSTLSEPHDKVIAHMKRFNFFDQDKLDSQVKFFSLTALISREKEAPQEIGTFIVNTARKERASLVVIDGLGALLDGFTSLQDTRFFLNQLSSQLGTLGITAFLALEGAYVNNNASGVLTGADGIIGLYSHIQGAGEIHRVEVHKLRGMKRLEGRHTYKFNNNGLVFFPRLESQIDFEAAFTSELTALIGDTVPVAKLGSRLGFGLPELEKMLNGGIIPNSSTFVAGSPGVGKTLLSLHYLIEGINIGEPALYVGFYEDLTSLVNKAARFNLDLRTPLISNLLVFVSIPSVELEPDLVAYRIKQVVEEYGIKRVVIDGVLELEIACRPDGRSRNYTTALDRYFKSKGITSLYTYTISKLIGTELDLSDTVFTVLAENLILLRQLAYESRLFRVVSVLKMRDSIYDLSIREFTIENEVGIKVLQPFQSETALLEELSYDLTESTQTPVQRQNRDLLKKKSGKSKKK